MNSRNKIFHKKYRVYGARWEEVEMKRRRGRRKRR